VQEAFVRTNVTDPGELAERVEDAQGELRDAAEELEGVQPPEDVEAENAQIARGFRAYAEELDRLRNAAEQGDERTIDDFNTRISRRESVGQIAEAAERIKFKGYDIGLIAEE
jgi:acyl-CoA reductase-like NAD-dependent aldehyde dehydrogenase